MKTFLHLFVCVCLPITLRAIPISVDAGNDGWTGWVLDPASNTGSSGNFLGTSNTIDSGAGNQSWGLYANTSDTSAAVYQFGRSLAAGESVSIAVSIGFIDSGGTVGFGLQDSLNQNRFEAYYRGGDGTDSWKLNDAEGEENILGPVTTFAASTWQNGELNSLTFTFTQQAGNTYDLNVNGFNVINSARNLNASDISQIRLFNFNAGAGGGNDQFFNNLEVIPEPESLMMLMGGLGFLFYLRRHRRS